MNKIRQLEMSRRVLAVPPLTLLKNRSYFLPTVMQQPISFVRTVDLLSNVLAPQTLHILVAALINHAAGIIPSGLCRRKGQHA
jgi:hypothetical protein